MRQNVTHSSQGSRAASRAWSCRCGKTCRTHKPHRCHAGCSQLHRRLHSPYSMPHMAPSQAGWSSVTVPAGRYHLSCLQGAISQEMFQGPAFSLADSLVRLNLVLGSGCFLVVCGVEAFVLWRLFLCRQARLSWWGHLSHSPAG